MKRLAAELGWPSLCTSVILVLAALYPIDNSDTFGHLAAGRQIVELGSVPKLDSFSYFRASPQPWVNYEWLSDWLFYTSYHAWGDAGLHLLRSVVLVGLALSLVATAWARAGVIGAQLCPLIVLLTLPAARFRFTVRPHLFGLLFAAFYILGLCVLLRGSGRKRYGWVAALALIHVAWVNVHGSHLLGLLLVALAWVTAWRNVQARVPLTWLVMLQLIACCISPYGAAIVSGAVQHTFDPAYRALILEWQAWRPTHSFWLPIVVALHALALLLSARALPRDALRTFSWLVALILCVMAVRSVRFMPDFVLLTAPTLAAALSPAVARWPARRVRVLLPSALVVGALWSLAICPQLPPRGAFGTTLRTSDRPLASALWLAQHWPNARIMAEMADAWALTFELPNAQFLLDGRTPFYGPEHVRRVQRAWSAPAELRSLLDATATDVVVVRPLVTEQQPALRALLQAPDFRLVVIEAEHCVFARVRTQNAPQLEAAALHALRPSYAPDWLVDAPAALVRAELARLPAHPNVEAYRAWVMAMLSARSALRAGNAGFAPPRTTSEQAAAREALRWIRAADRALPNVPSVAAYHALLAVTACEVAEARDLLERMAREESTRELLLGQQELALREGARESVQAFLSMARSSPAAAGDPWLLALEAELEAPPLCAAVPH